jgi:hypothetical protein
MQTLRALVITSCLSLFLLGCGEMDVVFSSNGTYRINAYIDSEYTLSESSVISRQSRIRPFFINSVTNDPDITGLTVFVQDTSGRIVSRKICYILSSEPIERTVFEEEELYPEETIRPEEEFRPEEVIPPEEEFRPEEVMLPETEGISEEESRSGEAVFPEDPAAPSLPAGEESGDTGDVHIEIALKKSSPKTETAEPVIAEERIYVTHLDEPLPFFRLFEELSIGQYNLIFHVQGKEEVLYKTYKPIYFLADAEFTLGDIQSYLPGVSEGTQLIPPNIYIVLETKVAADDRLDPYVVWYAGKKVIARGRVSERANCLLWKTPDQTGFHTIRAEVFPLLPEAAVSEAVIGRVKELSLPISLKHEDMAFFTDSEREFIHWYQFWGTLEDAKNPANKEENLLSLRKGPAQWIPYEGIYGLSIGSEDVYAIPGSPFALAEKEQGRGRILFHFVPLAEGTVFNASFVQDPGPENLILDLSVVQDGLRWHIGRGSEVYEETVHLNYLENSGFITARIDFEIAADHFTAQLTLENPWLNTEEITIPLSGPMSGKGMFRFGAGAIPGAGGRELAGRSVSIVDEPIIGASTAIINELAISYAVEVIPDETPEELPETEAGLPEEEEVHEPGDSQKETALPEDLEPPGGGGGGVTWPKKPGQPTTWTVPPEETELSPARIKLEETEKPRSDPRET